MKEVLSARYKVHGRGLNTKPPSVRYDTHFRPPLAG